MFPFYDLLSFIIPLNCTHGDLILTWAGRERDEARRKLSLPNDVGGIYTMVRQYRLLYSTAMSQAHRIPTRSSRSGYDASYIETAEDSRKVLTRLVRRGRSMAKCSPMISSTHFYSKGLQGGRSSSPVNRSHPRVDQNLTYTAVSVVLSQSPGLCFSPFPSRTCYSHA